MRSNKILKWTFLGFSLLLGLRLLLLGTELLSPRANVSWAKDRLRESLTAIARLEPRGLWILALGPSDLELALDAKAIDARFRESGLETTTTNFAVRDVGAVFPLYLARLELELQKRRDKPGLILVKLDPSRYTRISVRQHDLTKGTQDFASVLFDLSLLNSPILDWQAKAQLGFQKWILGERTVYHLMYGLRRISPIPITRKNRVATTPYNLWEDAELHEGAAWNQDEQGSYFWNIEKLGAMTIDQRLLRAKTEQPPGRFTQRQEECCGLMTMDFEPGAVQLLIQSLNNFKEQLGVQIVLLEIPESPEYQRSPEAQARLENFYVQVSKETSLPWLDLRQNHSFSISDYMDFSHFNQMGRDKFNAVLAKKLIEGSYLKKTRSPRR